jgi:virginiamycin B lyase
MKKSLLVTVISLLLTAGLGLLCLAQGAVPRDIAALPAMTEYAIPTGGAGSWRITGGPDGALWFTEWTGNNIGRMTTDGAVTEYPIPTAASNPGVITSGPDGALWFTEKNGNKIGRITTAGAVTEYALPAATNPYGITTGPDGALWYTGQTSNKIGRMTTGGVVTAEYAIPTATSPVCITTGPDGALWFTNNTGNMIGRVTTAGAMTEFPVPTAGNTNTIVQGPDGALWFTELDNSRIGRMTASGAVTEFPVPTAGQLYGLLSGPDGALWYANWTNNLIGRMTTSGVTSEYAIPTAASQPSGLANGSNGDVWFTEVGGNNIGTFSTERPLWYLAEGSTAWGYDCYVTLENPNTVAVNCEITYMPTGAPNFTKPVSMPPMSQLTVNPRDDIGSVDFSTRVECVTVGESIAVDRTMGWTGAGAPSPEAHCSVGVTTPATAWYLAEGSTNWGFECWLLIQNPTTSLAHCTVTYMIENEGPVTVEHTVDPSSRATFDVSTDIGNKDASIRVTSDVPVIPERAMYRNGRREGHDSIGTMFPTRDYFLAEGATGYASSFETYVLVQNPQNSPTDVAITYQTGGGPVAGPNFTMPPNSRRTILVNDQLPPNTDVSTHVAGNQAIIAERAMYWNGGPDSAQVCHDSIGLPTAHISFYLPDGETSNGRETWTLVQNPNATDVTVRIRYLTPAGVGADWNETVPANARRTFNMVDKGITGRAAVLVSSTDVTKKIMVERAMYWNSRGAGTDTIGGYSD